MSICPGEQALTELVDGELTSTAELAVVDHLAECAECCALLGRLEASLNFAAGGLADSGAWTDPAPLRVPRFAWRRAAIAAAAALLLAVPSAALLLEHESPRRLTNARVGGYDTTNPFEDGPPESDAELVSLLLADARELRRAQSVVDDENELLALGALAAARTRSDVLGDGAARARLHDVVERFPGTTSAREARALLADLGTETE